MSDAKANREKKMAPRNPGGEKNGRLDPGGEKNARLFLFDTEIVFLAVFFRVTHDGLSKRGTTRSLQRKKIRWYLH